MLAKISPNYIVNTDTVRSITAEGIDSRLTIRLTDGETVMADMDMEDAERFVGEIVPAPAGYLVIDAAASEDQDAPIISHFPVLAFRVAADGCCPITLRGEPDGFWALVYPGGRCENWAKRYDDTSHFVNDFRRLQADLKGKAR